MTGWILAAIIAVTGCVAFVAVSGSSIGWTSDQLPTLSGADALRDSQVRSETAAFKRARSLSESENSCAQCAEALKLLATHSQQRIDLLGGMWEPWADGEKPEDAPIPATLVEAPEDAPAFSRWLATSALEDLEALEADMSISGDQARTYGSVALGRLSSALNVAYAYGTDISDIVDITADPLAALDSVSGDDAQSEARKKDKTIVTLADAPEVTEAARTWDCVARTYPFKHALTGEISDATAREDVLLARVTKILGLGASNDRAQRCHYGALSVDQLSGLVVDADLDLLASNSPVARDIAVRVLPIDFGRWVVLDGGYVEALPITYPDSPEALSEDESGTD